MVLAISRISAMALSALLLAGFAQQSLLTASNAYAQYSATSDSASAVDMQAKQRASALSLGVKNKGGAPIYSFEVYFAENEVKKFRAPAGWKAAESDSSWVTFATEARPIGEGMKKTFRITLADRAPAPLEWSALGMDGEEVASGEWAPAAGMGMNSGRQEHEAEHSRSDPAAKQQSYPERQQQHQSLLSIFTDKESYRAGEDVTLYGKGEHGSLMVTVAVYDASGKTIAKKEVRPEDDGSFKLSISLREGSRGAHVAQAFQEDRTAAVRFVVKGGENNDNDDGRRSAASYNNYRYPEMRVSTDKPEYWQGESVFIHGQAFPDAKVKIKVVNREGVAEFRDEVAATADGAFRAVYTLDARAQAGERNVLAEVTFDGRAYGGGATFKVMGEAASSKAAPVPVVANAGPQVAVDADQDQYRPGSLVLVTAKTSSPGHLTIAVYAPDGSTAAKKEVETDRSGVAVFEHRLDSDAPAGLWTVLAVQESSQARDSFEVLKVES